MPSLLTLTVHSFMLLRHKAQCQAGVEDIYSFHERFYVEVRRWLVDVQVRVACVLLPAAGGQLPLRPTYGREAEGSTVQCNCICSVFVFVFVFASAA